MRVALFILSALAAVAGLAYLTESAPDGTASVVAEFPSQGSGDRDSSEAVNKVDQETPGSSSPSAVIAGEHSLTSGLRSEIVKLPAATPVEEIELLQDVYLDEGVQEVGEFLDPLVDDYRTGQFTSVGQYLHPED